MKLIVIITVSLFAASAISARAADAKQNWDTNCVQCHGKEGNADTKAGKLLKAKDLTDPKVQASFTDAEAADAIKNGKKEGGKLRMKAFGDKLNAEEITALVAYVRTLKK
jgi:mono/diheme cytochrome c family protein